MDFAALLLWLSRFDPRESNWETQQAMVLPALEECPHPGLLAMRAVLERGESVADLLEEFWQSQTQQNEDPDSPESLEVELLMNARLLKPWEWKTTTYQQFLQLAETPSQPQLQALRDHLTATWNEYSQLPVTPGEVTSDPIAVHRTLQRGYESWLRALDSMDHGEVDQALLQGEWATRLLVSVQKHVSRVSPKGAAKESLPCAP